VVDRDFSLFSKMNPADLRASQDEVMLREQLKVLSYTDYALAAGLNAVDEVSVDIEQLQEKAKEAIRVGLRAIEHAASLALKVVGNMELARRRKGLGSLTFDKETKAQLRTLPLGQEELFAGKLDEASRQAQDRVKRQRDLASTFRPRGGSDQAPFNARAARGQSGDRGRGRAGRGRASARGRGRGRGDTVFSHEDNYPVGASSADPSPRGRGSNRKWKRPRRGQSQP